MQKLLLSSLLWLLSKLPLSAIRGLGGLVGLAALRLSKKSARRLPHNLLITGLATPETVAQMSIATAKAMGMTLAEAILIAWSKNRRRIDKIFKVDASFYAVKQLLESGQNVVFLTPHIGNFEVAVKYFAYHLPMQLNILYKPAKNPAIESIMFNGRSEANILPVPTNRKGVLALMKHLKSGGCIGVLPDNVASSGDGEWVKFFGQDVYATSLAAKISQIPNTSVVLVSSLRTDGGFLSKCVPFKPSTDNIQQTMQELYSAIEELVREAPEQYYWSYDRFRQPENSKPKPAGF